jgi:GH25 family lysozyme M1 (1,4-beta-N-acetylmuramidase)
MEIKGIDVSAWNGVIDWQKVANYGMGFAILRITEKGNKTDSTFERNYAGCITHSIPVGVYKYSYATNISEIKYEAETVINVLKQRKLDYPVFLDIEDKCQENLSQDLMIQMIDTFRDIIIRAGYKFGIYCGYYWYKTKLPEKAKKYDCWLAAYPSQDDGTMQIRLKPAAGIGWQYSSKATIPGISGKVDRNVFYKDYTATKNEDKGETTMDKAIEKVILIAKNEEGYLEKKSNSQLDSKTANAGSANFTKYWRDIEPSYQGQPWCAAFVSWCFMKAFGQEKAKKLLKHWPYVYCPTLGNLFTRNANPKIGDIVIFYHNGTFTHTGIVTAVIGDRFYTIEGNTSGASGIIANGGGVCAKSYLNSQMPGTKFCTPDYSIASDASVPAKSENALPNTAQTGEKYMFNPETVKAGDKNTSVLLLQEILRARGFKGKGGKALKLTWTADTNTICALKAYQESRKEVLEVDGICGPATWKDLIAI